MEVPKWFCNNGQYSSSAYFEDSNSDEKQSTTSTTYEENSSCSIDTFVISPNSHNSCIASFKTITPQISHLAIHNNILYAASLNEITAFDLNTYELIDTLTSSFGLVKSIVFTKSKIFTAHQDCKIRIWKLKAKTEKHHLLSTLPTLKDRVRRGILPKNYVQIRRHKQKLWIEHADTVSGLVVNDGLMYSVSWDRTLKIWKMSDFSCLESVLGHVDAINAIVVSHDGVVYTASADGEIKVWQREKNKHSLVITLKKHKSSVNALALNKDGTILFSGGCDENILVWEREECVDYMLVTWSLKGHKGAILCLIYFDGVLISGSTDRSVRIWEKSSSSNSTSSKECGYFCSAVLEGHCKPVKSVAAAWDDEEENGNNNNGVLSVFSGSLDGEIRVWQVIVSTSRQS
ncbi:protein JINGUBANG-like [Lycium barbarum]|uniref:protein JINGUBANG-like n=1 Tax=Lycium barbarum TaxID=112863 RepID=UPI00293E9906|nr:protein JINGUBANG-like [Lycium barbarum]